jgi:thioredoxin reductase (NADPH)
VGEPPAHRRPTCGSAGLGPRLDLACRSSGPVGAEPRTDWLLDVTRLDDRGFILTGRDVPPDAWPLRRPPLPFETSLPGVFAAGDVRYGSVKRVAGAVGEGSVAVGSVHQYLAGPADT